MRFLFKFIFTVPAFFLLLPGMAVAAELETKYATVIYKNEAQLRTFNQKLDIGKLSFYIRDTTETVHDEIKQKVDVIIMRVQTVLDMKPEKLHFEIQILDSHREVCTSYKKLYDTDPGFIAFYSVGKNTVYLSLENTRLNVITHEFGHAVIENYFEVSPPRRIHEVLAQFAESHILD